MPTLFLPPFLHRESIKGQQQRESKMIGAMYTVFVATWQIFVTEWQHKFAEQPPLIKAVKNSFRKIDLHPNLLLNLLSFNLFLLLLWYPIASPTFWNFLLTRAILPSVFGGVVFLQLRFGTGIWNITLATFLNYVHNLTAMHGVFLVCFSQNLVQYAVGLLVDWAMPSFLRHTFVFPVSAFEDSLMYIIPIFNGMALLCLLTLPLWVRGFALSMEIAERNTKMSAAETALELLYMSSSSAHILLFQVPLALAFPYVGLPFKAGHFALAAIELLLINQTTEYKFNILHRLFHEVPELYAMAHVEHHICRGIHPTTSAAGLWELW